MMPHERAPEYEPAAPAGHLPRMEPCEDSARAQLLAEAATLPIDYEQAMANAQRWTIAVRANRSRLSTPDALLQAYGLSTPEGGALMRLAEALLRTPDRQTAWLLICETLSAGQWHVPQGSPLAVRMTGSLLRLGARMLAGNEVKLSWLAGPATWTARQAVAKVAEHFVAATSVAGAIDLMKRSPGQDLCSVDCLGESARTAAQAERYLHAYSSAITTLADQPAAPVHLRHGISVKLSALEPRFGPRHRGTYGARLIPAMLDLARQAAGAGIPLTIDAEEQDRLESTLDVAAALIDDPQTRDWEGFGIVVQAYGLRALHVIDWLANRARQRNRRIAVRLVKGAYWDSEVKRAQERGLDGFPVFTDKSATDISYLVAAQHLFERRDTIFPQFATHNALTIAMVRSLAPAGAQFEFQRLHGMGELLYAIARRDAGFPRVRIYAPVGSHEDLLAYLVRRLLENGANSSFVRHFLDPDTPVAALTEDPRTLLAQLGKSQVQSLEPIS